MSDHAATELPARFVQIAKDEDGLYALDANGDVWVLRVGVPGFKGENGYDRPAVPSHWVRLATKRGTVP